MNLAMTKPNLHLAKKPGLILALILVLVAIAGWSSFSYYRTKRELAKLSTLEGQQQLAQQEIDTVLTALKKRMILPETEQPTLATVTDVEALKKDQPFFEKAQNGDKVIVYVGDKKAIIYRPSDDLIVNVGFIAVNDDNSQIAGVTDQQLLLTVEVRNGTQTSGLAQKVADGLKGEFSIQRVGDAQKKDYTKTIIVDIGRSSDRGAINALAQALNAEIVNTLPDGENPTQALTLVIVGEDKAAE